MACNAFICTILFGLSESSKNTVFKHFIPEIIESRKSAKKAIFCEFGLNYLSDLIF